MWLKTAKEVKEQQLQDNVTRAIEEAGNKLVDDAMVIPLKKKSDILFPTDKMQGEIFQSSVIQRYSKEDIHNIIRKALDNNFMDGVDFEFAVTQNSLAGDQVESDNFFKYYVDSANHTQQVIALIPTIGRNLQNLSM